MLMQFSNHKSLITVFVGMVMFLWVVNLFAQVSDNHWTGTDDVDWSIQEEEN